jgi:hypothetical protein
MENAIRGIHDFLEDEFVYDEDRPKLEFYEDR